MTRISEKFLAETVAQETPSGLINGSNTSYSLAQTPESASAVALYLDGLLLTQGTDYTISGTAITMTTAPALAQVLRAQYLVK